MEAEATGAVQNKKSEDEAIECAPPNELAKMAFYELAGGRSDWKKDKKQMSELRGS